MYPASELAGWLGGNFSMADAAQQASPPTREAEQIRLGDLLLDAENPRFGDAIGRGLEQADILDHIVNTFGVDDVLSSLAINGYISAEPVVCRREKGSTTAVVVEGNRRLAACLILTGDQRAARQKGRTEQYSSIWRSHGSKAVDPLPAIVFEGADRRQALLSYLGVRHIASAQPWDSYAKAAWVAQVVEENDLPLSDVALMIGDQHRTIKRLLEGYYFVKEAIDAGEFRPQDSQRRGRGSVTDYPFSWVYTVLGYSAAREFVGLQDREPRQPLLAPEKLSLKQAPWPAPCLGTNPRVAALPLRILDSLGIWRWFSPTLRRSQCWREGNLLRRSLGLRSQLINDCGKG